MKQIAFFAVLLGLIGMISIEARASKSRSVICANGAKYKGEHDVLCQGLPQGRKSQCCRCIVAKAHCAYEPHGGGGVKNPGGCSVAKMVKMMRPMSNEQIVAEIDHIHEHMLERIDSKTVPQGAKLPKDLLNNVVMAEKFEVEEQSED